MNRTVITLVVLAAVGLGAWLRGEAIFNAFWLDEIWSLDLVRGLESPLGVFTDLHSDNNHILNSLYMLLLGDQDAWYLYRLPSLVAGLAIPWLVWRLARRGDPARGAIAVVLFSLSYLMVLYASEARGYAPMILFALLCLSLFVDVMDQGPTFWRMAGFACSAVLGVLAHLTFLHFYLGLLCWSAWRWLKGTREARRTLLVLHVAPLLFLAWLVLVHVRHIPGSKGPIYLSYAASYTAVLVSAASVAFGGPEWNAAHPLATAGAVALAVLVAGAAGAELLLLRREGRDVWILHAAALLGAPAVTLLLMRPPVVFLRYFMVGIVVLYLLAAGLLARAWRAGPVGRAACSLALALYVLGQGVYLVRFHRDGRGHYLEALSFMAAATPGRVVRMSSDHAFRNGTVVTYYQRFFEGKRLQHDYPSGQGPPPEWWLLHRFDRREDADETIRVWNGSYRRQAVYRHTAISGWTWFVYRLDPRPGAAPR